MGERGRERARSQQSEREREREREGNKCILTVIAAEGVHTRLARCLLKLRTCTYICVHDAGLRISGADELYHTRWDGEEGETVVRSPLTGTLLSLTAPAVGESAPDECDAIAELHVPVDALDQAQLLSALQYEAFVGAEPAGRFAIAEPEWPTP